MSARYRLVPAILGLSTICAIAFIPGRALSASAQTTSHALAASPAIGPGPGILCADKGAGLCLTSDYTIGDAEEVTNSSTTRVETTAGDDCTDNEVTGSCPFTKSALDSQYLRDKIINIYFTAHPALCVGAEAIAAAINRACPGSGNSTGDEWVEDGTYGLVNVYVTNNNGGTTGQYMASDGDNNGFIYIGGFQAGFAQWSF